MRFQFYNAYSIKREHGTMQNTLIARRFTVYILVLDEIAT
jgi:hypothetical protein